MSLRHAALGLLAERSGSGYDLLKRFQTAMVHVWTATQSQLYGELGKLESAGLIEVTAEGPRGRKEYAITDAGREELRAWLREPGSPQPRNETLLRVYFLGSLEPAEIDRHLTRMEELARQRTERLTALEASIDWDEGNTSKYGRMVLEWGLRYSAMQSEWVEWAREQVKNS